MKVDIDVMSQVRRKIRVELPPEVVAREFSEVYGRMVRRARVKGFRPGKVPRRVLEGIYGDEVRSEVLTHLVENSLREVFRERGLTVVSRPQVDADDLAEGKAFAFSAIVEVKPDIEVHDYLGMELTRVKLRATEAEVDRALAALRDQHAHLEPVGEDHERVAAGDFVLVDFSATVDGKPIPGGKAENHLVEVGSGGALPEFENALIGLKPNVPQQVTVTFPNDYSNRELAGKTAQFAVTVREIKKKVLPPLDDEFAKDVGEAATLAELRAKVRQRLDERLAQLQERELKEEILKRLIDAHAFDLPPAMIERQLEFLTDRAARGRAPAQGEAGDEARQRLRAQAERQVRARLIVEKIAERENISVSDAEIQQRVEQLARAAGERAAALRNFYRDAAARDELRAQMIFDRTLEFLLARAKVSEIEAPTVDEENKKS
ncbi:MAG TPA: trigger factor [Candidatus Acidoferrales bacterium]|nr:trigger factor [Candidatus Acidoferrales bacterium]